jgi:glycosyltransferase involved in cell wall biosynthesis
MGPLLRSRIPLAQRVVSLSRDMTADLERFGVPADRIEMVPNAVDHERFSAPAEKADLRRAHGIPADAFVFLCVARNHPQKDLPTLLRAFQKARADTPEKNLHLVMVGRSVPDLLADTAALGLAESTTLLEIQPAPGPGRIPEYPPQALVDLYRAADAFVLSSLLEGFSTALLEAMATGLPIVATRVPGIVDQIEDGREGVLVSPRSPQELATAMVSMSKNTELREGCKEKARAKSLRFSWDRVASDYLGIYRRLGRF